MRFADITKCELSNGNKIGVSLYVQGCPIHCKGCFNPSTWDFDGGREWNSEVENYFFKLIDHPYIERISILGGEPLSPININDVTELVKRIKGAFPDKKIWLYTGYTFDLNNSWNVVNYIDFLVDGSFQLENKDLSLPFRGSTNQRIIDIKETIKQEEIIYWSPKE